MTASSTSNLDLGAPTDERRLVSFAQVLRDKWAITLPISLIILVPCFWHEHIEAGDLGSHTYNAWLVQLAESGRAPGLSIQSMRQNVLFYWMLSALVSVFRFDLGEKIAVSLAVLLFFWSVVIFVFAVCHDVPWISLPGAAMLAYGWTFNAGFFNYYLAIGLSFLGLSIFCGQKGLKRLYALLLAPLMLLAHPLGLVWFSGAALYTLIAERVPPRLHIFLLGSAALLLLIIHKIMWSHFKVEPAARRIYTINGMDQLVIYGNRYRTFWPGPSYHL